VQSLDCRCAIVALSHLCEIAAQLQRHRCEIAAKLLL
jgi:hypothetical protein